MKLTKTAEAQNILFFIDSVCVGAFVDKDKNMHYIVTIDSDIEEADKIKVLNALRLFKEDGALVDLEWFDLATEPQEWLEF